MNKKIVRCLAAVLLLSITSCDNRESDINADPYLSGETGTVKIVLGMNGPAKSRAPQVDGLIGENDYNTAKDAPEFSDGTRATTLIYSLYNKDGERVFLKDPTNPNGEKVEQVVLTDVKFPIGGETLEFDLVKGLEYTLVFWAQSPEAGKYYNTTDLTNIEINYGNGDMLNNDEARDAFCTRLKLKIEQDNEEYTAILRRPFAQVNILFTENALKKLEPMITKDNIIESSITFSRLADRFNLLTNTMSASHDNVTAVLEKDTIPYHTKLNKEDKAGHELETVIDGKSEKYFWVSMSYLLVADFADEDATSDEKDATYSTLIDLDELKVFHNYNPETGKIDEALTAFDDVITDLKDIPVQRNHRTNIIFDKFSTAELEVNVNLCPNFDDELFYPERPKESEGSDNTNQ